MLIYLLKANVALVLFYLAYHFGLRRLTFYTLNRFFLLGGIICAVLCPFIDPSLFIQQHQPLNVVAETYIPDLSMLQRQRSVPLINVVLEYIFWTGVVVMSIRLMIQLLSLWKLHRHTTATTSPDDPHLRIMKKHVNPFSFMRNIYINPSLHSPEEFISIIRHEQVHVQQWHTLDVLMGELTKIFYWFNPGAWLMSIAIRENLEFITDRSILRQGTDAKAYQYSLIKVSGIPYATAIANNFNFSHLKQRIMMMNKKRSSRYHLLRYVVLGAVMGIAVLSLNFTRAIAGTESVAKNIAAVAFPQDTAKPEAVPAATAPVPPLPPPPPAAPKPVKKGQAVPVPAAPPAPAAPAASPAPAAVPPPPPPANPVKGAITLRDDDHKPLIFIDGIMVGNGIPEGLDPEAIQSINVLKGETAVNIYGPAGKDGVILVYTKANNGGAAIKANDGTEIKVVGYGATPAVTKSDVWTTAEGKPVDVKDGASTVNGKPADVKVNAVTVTKTSVNTNVNTTPTVKVDTYVNTDATQKQPAKKDKQ